MIVFAAGSILVLALVLLFAARVPQRLVDDLIYDNYHHYLPCEQLLTTAEIERALAEHAAIVDQIRAVGTDTDIQMDDEVRCPGTDHADLIIYYPSHSQRQQIEQILGGKTFFGLPVRGSF